MTERSAGPLQQDIYTSQTNRVRFTSMLYQGNRTLTIKKTQMLLRGSLSPSL